jgi:uncharacterized membrane protein YagU involved in acid resistance
MTLPPNPPPAEGPPDREEYIEEVVTPGQVQQRHVVRDEGSERYANIARVNQILWLLFGIILGLIAVRVVLKMIGANPAAIFAQMIYGLTDVFLWPFTGLTNDPTVGAFQFELSSIIGMIVYALMAWGITKLVSILFYRPNTTSETTVYRQRR